MTTAHRIEFESFFLFLLAAALGIMFATQANRSSPNRTIFHLPIMEGIQSPSIQLIQPKVEKFSQFSPDGRKEIDMVVTTNKDSSRTYVLISVDTSSNQPTKLLSVNFPYESLSIPFNAWSPDDNYVFVNKNTKSGSQALVFRGDGQALASNEPFYNAYEIFTAKQTGNTYNETTGWASETLLIINTTNNGSKSTSYWLEIPSKALISLSTQF